MPRKVSYLIVKVSHLDDMPATRVRLEVKTGVNDLTTYYAEQGDVKVMSVRPYKRAKSIRRPKPSMRSIAS